MINEQIGKDVKRIHSTPFQILDWSNNCHSSKGNNGYDIDGFGGGDHGANDIGSSNIGSGLNKELRSILTFVLNKNKNG